MSLATLASQTSALEQISALRLPTKRDEAWRYAPHNALAKLTFAPAPAALAMPADLEDQIPAVDGPRIVVVNGVFDASRSTLDALPAGLWLLSLADAATDHADALLDGERPGPDDALLDGERPGADDAFWVINRAYGTDGAMVQVDGEIQSPIHVVDVALPGADSNTSATRVVIDLAPGASATVIETRIGSGDAFGGSNVCTEISLAESARLEHIVLQDLPTAQVHLGRVDVVQAGSSTLQARLFNLGASYGRVAYHVRLAGEGAHADLSGLYFGAGDQTLDQQITVVHEARDCTSRQTYRGVLDDTSTGVWNGGVDVRPGADGTDSEQSNDNLLLSRRAEINTQPRLEILADEVSCQHGATVGQLDEAALYYLRARGIPKSEASRLLIDGFADQVMDDLDSEVIRAWIATRLGHRHA